MASKLWESKAYMRRLYYTKRMTPEAIAAELGCSHMTVYRWLKKHELMK